MREIKFRGLRTDSKGWVYGLPFHYKEEHVCFIIDNMRTLNFTEEDTSFDGVLVIPESVGQFTGLKDSKGIDIYGGDLLKYYQPYSKKWEIHIVLWDYKFSGFGLFEKNNEWCKESDWLKIQELEIIGNIHNNPELLCQ